MPPNVRLRGQTQVGVGITIAHDPLHGSGRAAFPHPALALGDNAHAPQRIGMTDRRQRQPASDETPHAIPKDAAVLAPPRQRAMPKPADSEPKNRQRRLVRGHSVVSKVSTHNRPQPLALLGDGFVHSSLKLGFHLTQLRLQPFPYRLPQHREPSIAPLLYADMRKTEKVERLRFPFSTPLPLVDRIRTELQKSRLLGMQLQVELPHAFRELRPELIGIRLAVKSNHDVVRETHHDDLAVRPLLTPRLDPQVEPVMEINVSQQRRGTAALGRPFFHPYSFPILPHTGVEPFLDQSHDAPICYPVLDEFHQPFVRNRIEEAANVNIEHPVHFSRQQSRVEGVQRLMLASPGRVFPARCPGRVLLGQVPFGQASSLHPLRCWLPGIVRGLPRYSRSVRLPRSVRHRRTSLDFPMRPRATAVLGDPGLSRFPREVLPYVLGVSDRAGLRCTSRYRCTGWGLPLSPTASASRSDLLTPLNTRPAHSLVNASTPPSRAAPHDSGSMWVATSHSYDSFIHYTSPV